MPLKPQIEHKAVIAFLSSFDNLSDRVKESYPQDYDREGEDSRDFIERKYSSSFIKLYQNISSKLFTIYNGRIVLRERELISYNLYYTALDVYPFFAYKLLDISKELFDIEQRFMYLRMHLDESFVFSGNLEEKLDRISDIHIHIGAAIDFHYRISELLKEPYRYIDLKGNIPSDHILHKDFDIYANRIYTLTHIIEASILNYYTYKDKNIDIEQESVTLSQILEILDDLHNSKEIVALDYKLYEWYQSINSIRTDSYYIKKYLYRLDDELEIKILKRAIEYFDEENINRDCKKADKLLLLFIIKKLIEEESKNSSSDITKAIKSYLILRNKIKQRIYQQHRRSGFGYFSSYSRNAIKNATKGELINIFKTAFHPEISTNIEYRSAIPNDAYDLHEFLSRIHYTMKELNRRIKQYNPDIYYQSKMIFHFIKRGNPSKDELKYENVRQRYQTKAHTLYKLLTKAEIRYLKDEKDNSIIDLAYEYFHGIDAASNELDTAPEAFAPLYRYFKYSVISSGIAISDAICYGRAKNINLQYTFHVGEEFRDIISGVRAIYESVIFLDLKEEDRIGHALALGIDPKIVLNDRVHITLTKGEYMDNLVFLYYIFHMSHEPPYSLEELRSKIVQLGNEIYGEISNKMRRSFSVDDYIDAWLLRRNCPLKVQELINALDDKINRWLESNRYLSIDDKAYLDCEKAWILKKFLEDETNSFVLDTIEGDIFDREYLKASLPDFISENDIDNIPLKRYLSIHNNQKAYIIYWAYSSNSVKTDYEQFYDGSVIFPTDIYEYLQDYVMESVVSRRDIVIEILPTSNLLIGSIKSMDNHPFLRFHPPHKIIEPNRFNLRTRKIKIAVGTDDPGIQGTSLMMEYHILYDIVSRRYSKNIAQDYIKHLVEFGNYLFEKGKKR